MIRPESQSVMPILRERRSPQKEGFVNKVASVIYTVQNTTRYQKLSSLFTRTWTDNVKITEFYKKYSNY